MTRDQVIEKIRKCFALSKSPNEHEAAAALRQASKLMQAHGLSEADLATLDIQEAYLDSGVKRTPVRWQARLAQMVGRAFGCKTLLATGGRGNGRWLYIGPDPAPEIARYALQVLLRQAKKARASYIGEVLYRCAPATKTRRADLFCDAWVSVVLDKLTPLVMQPQQHQALDAYLLRHYPAIAEGSARDRTADQRRSAQAMQDMLAGMKAGQQAELHQGLAGETATPPLALTQASA